ncbi:MAG: M56 family metallopeptidase [Gemmatimonadota bacterium]|nr:M56 family metallopeptidase [Gemmatimonadota bacterium]
MTGFLLQIAASKLALSIALAAMVWLVQRCAARPAIVHSLWLLVLGSLLVPAVVPLRVLPERAEVEAVVAPVEGAGAAHDTGMSRHEMGPQRWLRGNGESLMVLAWFLGSIGFFGWTLVRTVRFQRKLMRAARPATRLRRHAAEIGGNLGLRRVPRIYTTHARLRPMVWWTGGRVRILIPSMFPAELDETELRALLAHELAHVRRRDHLVRVVEWLACSVWWWNPVVWWTRRELRSAEESSCDLLAVSAIEATRGGYARSLLRAVEVLSAAPVRPTPALASAAVSGSDSKRLEKRLRTVLGTGSNSPAPRWLHAAGRVALMCGLCVGLVYCDAAERVETPETGQPPGAQVRDTASFLFAPDTLRNWIVLWTPGAYPRAWYPEEFMRGPGPLAMAADPTTSCHLDAAAWNEGDRPTWDCIIIDPDDAVLFTEVPVTSVSASDSSRLTSLLNRDRRRLHEALRFYLGRSSGYVLLAGRGHRPARPR